MKGYGNPTLITVLALGTRQRAHVAVGSVNWCPGMVTVSTCRVATARLASVPVGKPG